MKGSVKGSVAACVALVVATAASAKDLLGVYHDAVLYDAQIRQADATRKAAREANPQAWAELLPQISGSYAFTREKIEQSAVEAFPGPGGAVLPAQFGTSEYASNHGYQLQLQQSLFNWAYWAGVSKAKKQVGQAEADYRAAQENLIQRTAQAYFNVLSAQDTLDAQAASLEAISRQLDQANKRFEVGLIAITDVKEAQAARDSAAAAVIDAKRQLASQQQVLREITNLDYPSLSKPGENMPLEVPQPADPDRWVQASMDQNLSLVSSRLGADVARENVQIAFAGHLPTLSFTASTEQQDQAITESLTVRQPGFPAVVTPVFPAPGSLKQSQIGVQLSVPIFSGGLVSSQKRQAQYQWIAAKENVVVVSRQTEHQARDAYSGVLSEVARVNALKQGVISAEVALKATEAGYEVGTRTAVEVLQQRQSLVQAQTNYAQAKYAYLMDIITLRLAAGTLDEQTLKDIDQWLTVNQPTNTSPVTAPTPAVTPQP